MVTHTSGHPSTTRRAQDSESTPAKDRRYTAGPRNQPKRGERDVKGCVDYNVFSHTTISLSVAHTVSLLLLITILFAHSRVGISHLAVRYEFNLHYNLNLLLTSY